jgi:hypothetical protein
VRGRALIPGLLLSLALAACDEPPPPPGSDIRFRQAGALASAAIDESSGLQVSLRNPGMLWTHNDDGEARVYAVGHAGEDLGHFDIEGAVNADWEDMTLIPGVDRDLLVLADIGDGRARRERVWLWFVEEPAPGPDGRVSGEREPFHWIRLSYPDGPRDAESVAWDAGEERLLILSKRDRPPRLYALDLETALESGEATLEALGTVDSFRAPSPAERAVFGDRAPYVSQPTGMDLSLDGRRAAVITYRSLYLFERAPGTGWAEALNGEAVEILGPPAVQEEAVSFSADGEAIWVTSEGVRAPLYEFRLSGDAATTVN